MHKWTDKYPRYEGIYEMRCMEVPEVALIKVYREPFKGLLCETDLGNLPVDVYHNGLTCCLWRLLSKVTGTEARVCQDIAERQAKGIAKYGVTTEDNPLPLREWLQHAYEETLDKAVYLRRAIEEIEKEANVVALAIERLAAKMPADKSWHKHLEWAIAEALDHPSMAYLRGMLVVEGDCVVVKSYS